MQQAEVEDLVHQVTELTRCYRLWWYFMNEANANRYGEVQRSYPEFFITLADAVRQSFFVTAHRLFDKDNQSVSLRRLIIALKTSEPSVSRKLQDAVDREEANIEKMKRLRHKVFAHRDRSMSPKDWFTEVGITPGEIQSVVQLAQNIISTAADGQLGKDLKAVFRSCEDAVEIDTYNLMQVLEKYER